MDSQSSQLAAQFPHDDRTIRLLLDGRKLGHGGIGVYIENVVQGLLGIGGVEISVIGTERQAAGVTFRDEVAWIFDSARPYSLDELLMLPRRIDFSRFDVYHSPHYTLPYRIPIKTIITVHDLIHIQHPERFYYPWVAKTLIRSAVRRANAVIAVSNATARCVAACVRQSAEKINHIPNAVPAFLRSSRELFMPGDFGRDAAAFFLTVFSNLKPHKGFPELIDGYRDFRRRFRQHDSASVCPELVLVGYGAELLRSDASLSKVIEGVEGVRVLGAVSKEDLRGLYQKARALVVPSRAEGFCLPALEAQACGTPVICRPVPALEELLTEQDIVAEDFSVRALEAALYKGAVSSEKPRRIVEAHLDRFSLNSVALRLRDLYSSIINAQ